MRYCPSRRRFLQIFACALAAPDGVCAAPAAARWQGTALGANASIVLGGMDSVTARSIVTAIEAEIERLDSLFSLYRADSALVALNRDGVLPDPPGEMLELISLCDAVYHATSGAFDPSIQPLWSLYAATAVEGRSPTAKEIDACLEKIGWPGVAYDSGKVTLDRPGMALTLNGVAQGYVTDRIAALLRGKGLKDILVDMGEIAARGSRPGGGGWRADVADPKGSLLERVTLTDRALATSAPLGTVLDAEARLGHILDPHTGRPDARWQLVSVSAPTAALADGLSTAFCLMPRDEIDRTLEKFPSASVEALV